MNNSKVETISRLAQWKIDSLGPCFFRRSDAFKVGIWNWYLCIEKNRYLYVRLFPEPCRTSKEQPPVARIVLRITNAGANRKPYISPGDEFVWPVDSTFQGRFIIDVEFLDLKISPIKGGEASSIWPNQGAMEALASRSTLQGLARMLDEGIHTNVTINTSNGSLRAHKAILSASSPVFASIFSHDLKEKESSTINIEDVSLESCTALLSYMYGSINQEEFWKHRLSLLGAANKYDIPDLKECCEESLMEDINSSNVLERLQEAWLYQLDKLKKGCLTYLFDFGKIYDLREEVNNFFRHTDRELMMEMFQEVLTVWKPL
ncbi:BTB/POZ domain-containing protein At1g21780-like isoform X2 [Aristolochia californica]|uniref:BTB/POZ domain-containing protein At1g21780-like isoform X2 n=1 Tax=Aristolochia californica TaxID=171875 RepID=UPI0035D75A17